MRSVLAFRASLLAVVAMSALATWWAVAQLPTKRLPVTPKVGTDVVSGVPLEMSDVHPVMDTVQPYVQATITNSSHERLLSAEVTWHLVFTNGTVLSPSTRVDYFFDETKLRPGSSDTVSVRLPELRSKKDPTQTSTVSEVTGKVTFAEFANGTRLGEDRERMQKWLAGSRNSRIAEYQELLNRFQISGRAGLQQALKDKDASINQNGAAIRYELEGIEADKGIDEVVKALNRRANLKVPE